MFSKYLGKFSRSRTYPVEPGKTKQFLDQKGATSEADKAAMAGKDYLGLIGCLSYIVHQTRLDCNYHVNFLSQFMASLAPPQRSLMRLRTQKKKKLSYGHILAYRDEFRDDH